MNRALLFLLMVGGSALLAIFAACSGGDTKLPDAAADTGPADTGIDCGPTNVGTLHCREGAPGKACGNLDQPPVKVDPGQYCSMYKCSANQTPVNMCGCNAEGAKVDAGDDCPGGGSDSGATD
jgi:hypothetical protein